VSPAPPPDPGGRTPEEREAARLEREARRAARAGKRAPQPPSVETRAPQPPSVEASPRAERLHAEPAAPDAPSMTAERPIESEPEVAAEPVPAEADGHRRDWLAEARPLTHGGDGGGGRGPGHGRTTRGRRGPGRLIALAALVLILLGIAWFAVSLFQPFKGEGDGAPVRVKIPQGSSLSQIADRLEQNGVIDNAGFFQLRARLTGHSGDLRPGSYQLRKDMTFAAALDALQEGVPPNVVQVSIPEGLSRKEIAPLTGGLRGKYVPATRRARSLNPRRYGAKGATSLEGFLFPATYELKKGQTVARLRDQQLELFKRNFDKVDLSYAKRKNLTPYDVLIIASLIEREAAVPKERRLVSSVIYNRLKNDISLGIDATVRFVTGNWTEPLRQSELANPSPYNTRLHQGLPPGPIGNPGLASIRAAANPARTRYLFYVAAVCGNGRHKFAKTDAEFQAYVNEYNRAREARGGKSPTKC
jgi:UPF0755 protein